MQHYLTIPAGEMFVHDEGEGDIVLLVHGFPLDHTMWRHQIEFLAKSYRVLAPDLRGFGNSRPVSGTLSMEALAIDLHDMLHALNIAQPVIFCGLSMGGYVAWQFAKRYPQLLARLIVCDSRAAADAPEQARARLVAAERLEREQQNQFLIESMLPRLFSNELIQQSPKFVQETIAVMQRTSCNTCAAAQRGMAERPDMRDLLPSITCPTLILCGEHDVISPAAEMREIATAVPHAHYVEVKNAGHMAPLEKSQEVNTIFKNWLFGKR
jgi:3-oxoadipate enol-lactonase